MKTVTKSCRTIEDNRYSLNSRHFQLNELTPYGGITVRHHPLGAMTSVTMNTINY